MCMWKELLIVTNPQIIIPFSTYATFKHLSANCFGLTACNFTVLIQPHRFHLRSVQMHQAAICSEEGKNLPAQQSTEQSVAFSCFKARYFSQVGGDQTRAKSEWILDFISWLQLC